MRSQNRASARDWRSRSACRTSVIYSTPHVLSPRDSTMPRNPSRVVWPSPWTCLDSTIAYISTHRASSNCPRASCLAQRQPLPSVRVGCISSPSNPQTTHNMPRGHPPTTLRPSRRLTASAPATTWNTAHGATCQTTTGYGRTTSHGSSESSCGQATTIWANPRPTTSTGPRAAAISVYATLQDCPRTAITCTVPNGTRRRTPSISYPTGAGATARRIRATALVR